MLPIPVAIITPNKRLFIPLLYLAITASICYIFLLAFVKSTSIPHYLIKEPVGIPLRKSSETLLKENRRRKTFEKFKREVETDRYFDAYIDQRHTSEKSSDSWKVRKKKENQEESTKKPENGTWRSNPTKIWVGHQDLIDHNSGENQPWPEDQQCSGFRIHFAKKGTFKPRAIVSFPGSGNSWLRYLIECGTGFFTGSVFNDTEIALLGLLGELRSPNDGSTIVQKTHHDALRFKSKQAYVKLTELMFGYRGILVIRNPYDALLSYWNFVETRDHKGFAPRQKFNSKKWANFVRTLTPKWTSMIKSWVENSQSLLIVRYEKLKKNPYNEMIRILRYLDQPVDEDRLTCLLKKKNIEGPFHRGNKIRNSFFTSNNNPFLLTDEKSGKQEDKNLENSYNLTVIVQDNVDMVNQFFSDKFIPIFLPYKGPSFA